MHDAILGVEALAQRELAVNLLADAPPVVRMRQRFIRQAIVEQQIVGIVAGEPAAAFADELHGPGLVIAAAIDHAVEITQQRLEHARRVAADDRGIERGKFIHGAFARRRGGRALQAIASFEVLLGRRGGHRDRVWSQGAYGYQLLIAATGAAPVGSDPQK